MAHVEQRARLQDRREAHHDRSNEDQARRGHQHQDPSREARAQDAQGSRISRIRETSSQAQERDAPQPAVFRTGTNPRKDAEAVVARRAKGETISAIAEDLKTSIATVRRMETNLELARQIEAGERADKWIVGEKQVVISVVEGKLP